MSLYFDTRVYWNAISEEMGDFGQKELLGQWGLLQDNSRHYARDHLIISRYGTGDTNIVAFDSSKGICLFLPYLELADEAHSPKPTTLHSLGSVHSDHSL